MYYGIIYHKKFNNPKLIEKHFHVKYKKYNHMREFFILNSDILNNLMKEIDEKDN